MKVVIILGSRNPNGQTASAVKHIEYGIASKGVVVEKFFLPVMHLEHCRQCEDNGWGICINEGKCTINDDFHLLVDKLKEADSVVFATPVYFGDLSESMKSLLDRLRRICMNENGKNGIYGKNATGICVAGGGGGGSSECLLILKQVLSSCGFNVFDIIPVRRQHAVMKDSILRTTGETIADLISPT